MAEVIRNSIPKAVTFLIQACGSSTAGLRVGRYSHATKKTSQTPNPAYKSCLPFWHVTGPFLEWTLEGVLLSYAGCMMHFHEKEVFRHPQKAACLDLHSDCPSVGPWAKVPVRSLAPKVAGGKRAAEVTPHNYQSVGCHTASNVILPLGSPAHIQHETLLEYSQLWSRHLYLSIIEFVGWSITQEARCLTPEDFQWTFGV